MRLDETQRSVQAAGEVAEALATVIPPRRSVPARVAPTSIFLEVRFLVESFMMSFAGEARDWPATRRLTAQGKTVVLVVLEAGKSPTRGQVRSPHRLGPTPCAPPVPNRPVCDW